jgi:hypothetical protein
VAQAVKHQFCKCKALSSNPNPTKKIKKKRRKEKWHIFDLLSDTFTSMFSVLT